MLIFLPFSLLIPASMLLAGECIELPECACTGNNGFSEAHGANGGPPDSDSTDYGADYGATCHEHDMDMAYCVFADVSEIPDWCDDAW